MNETKVSISTIFNMIVQRTNRYYITEIDGINFKSHDRNLQDMVWNVHVGHYQLFDIQLNKISEL